MDERKLTDEQAMDSIADELSGVEWSADTLDAIASIVKLTGREIEEPSDG